MQSFAFEAPTTVAEAVELLAERRGEARVLGGGTDLISQLQEGRRTAELVVDVKRIPELTALNYHPDSGLQLGAAVPCYRMYGDPEVAVAYPGLIDSAELIGGKGIQGRASFGGNLCNASPAADSIPAMIAHHASCLIAGPGGQRTVPVEDFCTAPGQTVLEAGEFLVSIDVPAPPARFGAHYLRFIPRNEMDIAVVGAGASVVLGSDGETIEQARVSLGAVAPTPLLVAEAGDSLFGKTVSDEAIDEAARLAQDAARPIDDMRGTIRQRKHLAAVLTRRALTTAIARARGAKGPQHG